MSGKSSYLEAKVLNWVKGSAFGSAPSTVYAALFTTQPADDGTGGAEVSGNAYARIAITLGSVGAASGSGQQISNSATVTFPQATGSWGTITSFGVFDALTTGNLLYAAPLTASKTVSNTDQIVFAIGALVIKED